MKKKTFQANTCLDNSDKAKMMAVGVATGKTATVSETLRECIKLAHERVILKRSAIKIFDGASELPSESDADSFGEVLIKRSNGGLTGWETEHFTAVTVGVHWAHTPSWTPKRSLRSSCIKCQHIGKLNSGRKICGVAGLDPKTPYYVGDTPCHMSI